MLAGANKESLVARLTTSFSSARIGSKELTEAFFVDGACSQLEHRLCRSLLAPRQSITIELEKQQADHKAGALVAINEGMILNDARRVLRSKSDDVGTGMRNVVKRSAQRGLKQRTVAYASGASMFNQ